MTEKQRSAIECCDAWLKVEGLPTYSELSERLATIKANAVLISDPRMQWTTDCYAVPLDDIEVLP